MSRATESNKTANYPKPEVLNNALLHLEKYIERHLAIRASAAFQTNHKTICKNLICEELENV